MADDTEVLDELETGDDLEGGAGEGTKGGAANTENGADKAPAVSGKDRFERLGDRLHEINDKITADAKSAAQAATTAATSGADAKGDAKPKDGAAASGEDKSKKADSDKTDAKASKLTRGQILDAEGNEYELDWPEGAEVRFKADGKVVSVRSMDDLVDLAQKGVHMHRRIGEFSKREETLSAQTKNLQDTVIRMTQDPDFAKAMRKELRHLRDPKVREAFSKAARHDEESARRDEETESQRGEKIQEFWGHVESTAKAALEKYPHLIEDDVSDAVQAFYDGYSQHLQELTDRYVTLAPKHDVSEEDARAAAAQDAARYLTQSNLFRHMKTLNDRIEKRLGKSAKPAKGAERARQDVDDDDDDLDEEAGTREADRHNAHVRDKTDQRRTKRALRGGGGLPMGGGTGGDEKPRTFEQRMSRISRMLRGEEE